MNKSLFVALAALGLVGAANASLLFDDMSGGVSYTQTTSTPHTLMGMPFSTTSATGPVTISSFDYVFASLAAATYSDVQFNFSFFTSWSGATTGTGAAFTGLAGSVNVDIGAFSPAAATVYGFTNAGAGGSLTVAGTAGGITLGTPITIAAGQNLGVQINIKTNTAGAGLVNDNNLSSAIRSDPSGVIPIVGSLPLVSQGFQYYRNAGASESNPTDASLSLLGGDARNVGVTNGGLLFRFYGTAVPEPASLAVLGIGALALIRRRRSNKA